MKINIMTVESDLKVFSTDSGSKAFDILRRGDIDGVLVDDIDDRNFIQSYRQCYVNLNKVNPKYVRGLRATAISDVSMIGYFSFSYVLSDGLQPVQEKSRILYQN